MGLDYRYRHLYRRCRKGDLLSHKANDLDISNFLNEYPDFSNLRFVAPEIGRNPFLQILGFTDIQDFPFLIVILIHPGTVGQFADNIFDM